MLPGKQKGLQANPTIKERYIFFTYYFSYTEVV